MTHQQLKQGLIGFWWGLTVTSAFFGGVLCGTAIGWVR